MLPGYTGEERKKMQRGTLLRVDAKLLKLGWIWGDGNDHSSFQLFHQRGVPRLIY
jgi:hypothetical protein